MEAQGSPTPRAETLLLADVDWKELLQANLYLAARPIQSTDSVHGPKRTKREAPSVGDRNRLWPRACERPKMCDLHRIGTGSQVPKRAQGSDTPQSNVAPPSLSFCLGGADLRVSLFRNQGQDPLGDDRNGPLFDLLVRQPVLAHDGCVGELPEPFPGDGLADLGNSRGARVEAEALNTPEHPNTLHYPLLGSPKKVTSNKISTPQTARLRQGRLPILDWQSPVSQPCCAWGVHSVAGHLFRGT